MRPNISGDIFFFSWDIIFSSKSLFSRWHFWAAAPFGFLRLFRFVKIIIQVDFFKPPFWLIEVPWVDIGLQINIYFNLNYLIFTLGQTGTLLLARTVMPFWYFASKVTTKMRSLEASLLEISWLWDEFTKYWPTEKVVLDYKFLPQESLQLKINSGLAKIDPLSGFWHLNIKLGLSPSQVYR